MRVWIDQELCTGDGICVEICPKHFQMSDDGLAYVKEAAWKTLVAPGDTGPDPSYTMADGLATFDDADIDDVIEAAEACPGECIFISE